MAFVHEIQIKSSGFPGAPGYTNLYFETTVGADHDPQFAAVKAALDAWAAMFPTTWSGTINPAGRIIEATTGVLGGLTTAPAPVSGDVPGRDGSQFGSGVSGVAITWFTATLGPHRVIRGRTFFVPVAVDMYNASGQASGLADAARFAGSQALLTANVGFCIWHRPVAGAGGLLAPVVSAHNTPTAVFLSSRRS